MRALFAKARSIKRIERRDAIAAAKVLNDAIERAYYEDYPLEENAARHLAVEKARSAYESISLMYFLGAGKASVASRLKRRAARRKLAEQRSLVA